MNDEPQGPQGPEGPPGPQGAQGPGGPRRRRRRSRRRQGNRFNREGAQAGSADSGGAPHDAHAPAQRSHGDERGPRPQQHGGQRSQGQRSQGQGQRHGGQGRQRQRGRGRPHRGRRPWQRRGRGADQWWARRWTDVLESFEVGRRLGRGRLYARQGQVLELDIGQGFVTAQVQGSRDAPYLVRMRFSMLSSTDWKKVTKELAADPVLGPGLASGQMPEGVEEVFEGLGLSLFPRANGDLKTACSCPDPANPCKHVAAVYYLLGEEIARDPYLLFKLRGLDRNDLVTALGGPLRGTPMPPPPRPPPVQAAPREPEPDADDEDDEREDHDVPRDDDDAEFAEDGERDYGQAPAWAEDPLEPEPQPQPLPSEPHSFWAGGNFSARDVRETRIPAVPAALTKRLGALPFARGEDPSALLERIYRNASHGGLEVFLGERAEEES
ncbi:MAG TPA: SWIM zinc finger family protein [Myxococcota bacterium]|nr:SWIM zinc finger family protein [Myxococcota bacterium]